SFARKPETEKIGRLTRLEIAPNRARNVRFAGVVRRDREQPVAVEFIRQEFQVVERGGLGREHIAATVVVPVLLEPVAATGARNELPQAGRSSARIGDGVE